jgi:hypothetical protein
LVNLLKLVGWKQSQTAPHWRAEAIGFLRSARRCFAPSMRQHLDIAPLYADTLAQVGVDFIDGRPPAPLPSRCPFTLDDLLFSEPDVTTLAARLAAEPSSPEG